MKENEKLVEINGVKSPFLYIEITSKPQIYFYSIKSYYSGHEFAFIPKVSVVDEILQYY